MDWESEEYETFIDDISGAFLDLIMVRTARDEELELIDQYNVWQIVDTALC